MNGAPIEEAAQIRRRLTRAGSKAPLALGVEDRARFFRLISSDIKHRTDASLPEDYVSYSRHGGRGAAAVMPG